MTSTIDPPLPDVSVVIPVKNRHGLVSRAIASALDQDFDGVLEVIVVDDASSDATAEVVEAYPDARVRLIRRTQPDGGGTARNDGIRAAKAPVVAFLDSDDVWARGKIRAQLGHLRCAEMPDKTVIYSPCWADFGSGRAYGRPGRAITPGERVGDYLFLHGGLMITTTLLMPTALARSVMFTDSLPKHQDWDLCLRLEAAGAAFTMTAEPLATWYRDARDERVTLKVIPGASSRWLESVRDLLSENAYRSKRAEFLTRDPEARRRDALVAIGDALIHRALSPAPAASLALEVVAPKLRTKLRHLVTKSGLRAPTDISASKHRSPRSNK